MHDVIFYKILSQEAGLKQASAINVQHSFLCPNAFSKLKIIILIFTRHQSDQVVRALIDALPTHCLVGDLM